MTLGRLVDKKLPGYNPEEKVYVKGKFHKKKDIVSALKLKEILNEEIAVINNEWYGEHGGRGSDLKLLQSLLKKSENQ